MHLNITPELVRDLADYINRGVRADQTGIILTPTGWDTDVNPDGLPSRLTALTLDDVYGYLDSDDAELTDDDMQLLADGPDSTGYRIPFEDGNHATPKDGQDPRVVLPSADEEYGQSAWEGAWWFDLAAARELIGIDHTEWRMTPSRRQSALMVTQGGRYLRCTYSNWVNEFGESWTEITPAEAAERMYQADPDLITEAEQPPLMTAARAAAELVAGVAAPEVPERRYHDESDRAWEVEDEAALVVRDAAVIATLVRERVAADLRKARAEAARICVRAADGNTSEAARRLGIAQQTLAQLARE